MQKGEPTSLCSTESHLLRQYAEQKKRDNKFNAATKKGPIKERTRNPKGYGQDMSEDRQIGDCAQWTFERPVFARIFVQLQAPILTENE